MMSENGRTRLLENRENMSAFLLNFYLVLRGIFLAFVGVWACLLCRLKLLGLAMVYKSSPAPRLLEATTLTILNLKDFIEKLDVS